MTADPVTLTGQLGAPHLAVDVIPDTGGGGVFTLDVSELDGSDMLLWSLDDPGAWVNIVCDVIRVNYRRGQSRVGGLGTQAETGTVTVQVSDTRRQLDPANNADVIHKGTPLRLRAWGFGLSGERWDAVLFTGEVDEVGATYAKSGPPVVTVTGVDLIGPLAAWSSEGSAEPGDGAGETLRQRVSRALSLVGKGAVAADSDTNYAAVLAPNVMARPWQAITDAVEAELGRVWVNSAGQVVVRSRNSALTGTVRGTLSDVHGEAPQGVHCCLSADDPPAMVYGVEAMANRAIAARRKLSTEGSGVTPATVRLEDEASQARFGVGAVDRRSLELSTDAQVTPWAQAVIVAHTRPELRVDTVTPVPSEVDLDSALAAWQAVCSTDLGDRWRFLLRPEVGPAVDRTLGVLGIELQATPEAWAVTWTTEGTGLWSGWFVLDASQLDGPDLLAPFAVPA